MTSHSLTTSAAPASQAGALDGFAVVCTCGFRATTSLSEREALKLGHDHVAWATKAGKVMRRPLAFLAVVFVAGVLAAPAQAAAWRSCGTVRGNHVSANSVTSCALARRVARHNVNDFADGRRVRVVSPVTGRAYRFFLWFANSKRYVVHAAGARGRPLAVQVRY